MARTKANKASVSMKSRFATSSLPAALIVISLADCTVGPDFRSPAPPDVPRYTATPVSQSTTSAPTPVGESQQLIAGLPIKVQWWQNLDSPERNQLIW